MSDIHRCKLRVPRNARINATRVVEYVPQFEEQLQPRVASASTSLSPVTTALPSPPEGEHPAGEVPLTPIAGRDSALEGYEPTEIGSDDEDVAMVESYLDSPKACIATLRVRFGHERELESCTEHESFVRSVSWWVAIAYCSIA